MVFQDGSGTPASADPKEYVPTVFDNLILYKLLTVTVTVNWALPARPISERTGYCAGTPILYALSGSRLP